MTLQRTSAWAWYALAAALVALYVNMYSFWRWLSVAVGSEADYLPYVVTLALLGGLGVVAVRACGRARVNWWIVACALAFAVAGFMVTDPDYPSKRIHVPEYVVLALVVRRGLSSRLSGWPLTVIGWAIAVVFGCHDELAQGFHPLRTFGMADILTNAAGAAAGVLLAHGFGWMNFDRADGAWPPRFMAMATLCVFAGLGLEVVALDRFRDALLPYWSTLPLLGGVVAWVWADAAASYGKGWRHGLGVLVFASALAAIYPVISHVAPLAFN